MKLKPKNLKQIEYEYISLLNIKGGKQLNATEEEHKDLANKGRSLLNSKKGEGRQCKYDFKLQS